MTSTAPEDLGEQRHDAPFLLHRVRVTRRRRTSPGFVRITFGGPTLHRFADPGLDQRIKLILPAADGTLDALPFETGWYAAWRALPDERRPVVRTYTTAAVRPEAGEVDVDLVLHEPSGPAGRFAAGSREGDEVVLLGPNVGAAEDAGGVDFRLPASARRLLVAGDETALPAIRRIVAAVPAAVEGAVVVEVPHAEDAAGVDGRPGLEVRVLVRGDRASGSLLEPAVRTAAGAFATAAGEEPEDVDVDAGLLWEVPDDDGPDADRYAWLAGEAGVIKRLRRHLVADVGWDRRAIAFMGYWRLGRAEGD